MRDKETRKKYLEANKEKIKEQKRLYYIANREKLINEAKEYRKTNKKKLSIYWKNKLDTDVIYKFKTNVRNLIKNSLKNKGFKKLTRSEQILGCTFEEFKTYLESKFEPWMTWENRGLYNGELNYGWDIDHIIPLNTATCEADIIRLNHYTNLQPLCSYTNRIIKKLTRI
jgi:tRNA U34 5-carboxymethylaminomethyl modifying GTPase MnmE/TrmE